jgi:hypothetical protein
MGMFLFIVHDPPPLNRIGDEYRAAANLGMRHVMRFIYDEPQIFISGLKVVEAPRCGTALAASDSFGK